MISWLEQVIDIFLLREDTSFSMYQVKCSLSKQEYAKIDNFLKLQLDLSVSTADITSNQSLLLRLSSFESKHPALYQETDHPASPNSAQAFRFSPKPPRRFSHPT